EYLDHFGYLYGVPQIERRERIKRLLERFELADRADTVLAAYSRGMAQKIALIRATLHDPDWIFCDEPTAGLDPVAAADMRHYLVEQRERGAALIVTTHALGEAELIADRIAIMRRGVIVKSGTLHGLRHRRREHVSLAPAAGQPAPPLPSFLCELVVAPGRPELGGVPERVRAPARGGHLVVRPAARPGRSDRRSLRRRDGAASRSSA